MQKEYRLQKNEDFQVVFKRGNSVANKQLVLYYYKNPELQKFRIGFSISKKIGHAVVRNRLKRLLKEAVRQQADQIASGYDLIIIVRKPACDLNLEELGLSFQHVLKRAKLHRK